MIKAVFARASSQITANELRSHLLNTFELWRQRGVNATDVSNFIVKKIANSKECVLSDNIFDESEKRGIVDIKKQYL